MSQTSFYIIVFIIAQEIWHLVTYDTLVTLMFIDYLKKVIKMLHGSLVHVANLKFKQICTF